MVAFFIRSFKVMERATISFSLAGFFLWHGPRGFLLLKERLGRDTFTIGKNILVIFNLQLIKHCLVLNPKNYDKGGRAARLMGDVVGPRGILGALDESDHEPSYQVLNPHTKRADRLQDFEDMVLEETMNMLKVWQLHSVDLVDLYVSLNEVFFKVLYRFVFGMVLTKKKFQEVFHIINKLERYSAVVGFVPSKLLSAYNRHRKDVPPLMKALDTIVENILQEADSRSPVHEMQDPTASASEVQVKDTVRNLLFAGATTAANSLGWAVHSISDHDSHLKERARQAAKAQDVNFFKNVCLEANRIYPQANVVTRRAVTDEMVEGHRISKGTILLIPIIALHRDPELFKQAEIFDPDRWEKEKAPPLMAYIPFTAGPRQCIGQSLFNRAGPLLLMRVFATFSFTPLNYEVKPKWPNAVLPPSAGGFQMRIEPV